VGLTFGVYILESCTTALNDHLKDKHVDEAYFHALEMLCKCH